MDGFLAWTTICMTGPSFKVGNTRGAHVCRGQKIVSSVLDMSKLTYILKQQEDLLSAEKLFKIYQEKSLC